MAVPSYATDLNDIYTDGGSWTTLAGRVTDPDTDDYIQGSSCWSHDPFSAGIEGGVVNSAETITAGHAVFVWTKADISPALATHAAGGVQVLIGNAPTALKCFYVRGSDDLIYGGWKCIPVDPTKTPSTNIGSPSSVTDYFGVRWNIPSTGPTKGYPLKIDAIRHGSKLEVTAGEIANPASWATTSAYDAVSTRMWGICQPTDAGAALQGYIYWGTATTAIYSRDTNKTIVINDTEWTDTDFTQIIFANAGNDVVWDNVGLLALGTNNRGIIDVTVNPTTNTITWTNSVFQDIDITNLLASCVFDGSKWLSCNEVTAGGASLLNCKILTPTVAADSHGLLWNVASDPDGKLDGMEFSKGTNAHHAISFADTIPSTITLRNMVFTGFNATPASNDSALYFADTAGTITVNLVGCTGTVTAKSAGATIVTVIDPVTLELEISDIDTQVTISGVTVLVEVANGNNFPYQDPISMTGTGTTVTVVHSGHGLATNDYVVTRGAENDDDYNGVHQITVSGVNTYLFTSDETIGSSPATGTLTATFAPIFGYTDPDGLISDTRTWVSNQLITGKARKATVPPYYKQQPITGEIDNTKGLTITLQLISDE